MKNKNILIFLTLFLISSISALSVDDNTVALWNLDEGSGINVIDVTGYGNDGTIIGGATWTTDSVSEYALEFDGVDDYVPITKTSSLDVDEVTLEASVKMTSNTDGMVFSRNGPYYLAIRNNVISGGVMTTTSWGELSGVMLLEENVWYNLKLTYDGENLNLYVNDILDASMPKTGQIIHASQRGYIGYGEPGQNQYFTGIIDDVRISNIARTNSSEPPQPSCQDRIIELENEVERLNKKVTLLEKLIKYLKRGINPYSSIRSNFLCYYLKESGERNVTDFDLGLKCNIGENFAFNSCFCTTRMR